MNELVSIVIPVYQAEKTLERCVESIVTGTYQNVEVILVDDCSKDSSYEIGQTLEKKYSQVVCLHNEKNSGVSATRNKGLEYAHGTYLMFVDSDDWVAEDFVNFMVEHIRDGIMPICGYVNHDEIQNKRTDIFGWQEEKKNRKVNVQDGIIELYEKRLLQMIWNKVFIMEKVREYQLQFDTKLHCGEDFRFLLEYIECAKITDFLFLNKILYRYSRDNSDSLATKFTEIALEEPLYNLRKMYELTGKSEAEIAEIMVIEREKQLSHYAYAYMHNEKLTGKEKKQKILELPLNNGKKTYRDLKILYWKEQIRKRVGR